LTPINRRVVRMNPPVIQVGMMTQQNRHPRVITPSPSGL
jgi:hypothetical protein